jgi:hypothetical protein
MWWVVGFFQRPWRENTIAEMAMTIFFFQKKKKKKRSRSRGSRDAAEFVCMSVCQLMWMLCTLWQVHASQHHSATFCVALRCDWIVVGG